MAKFVTKANIATWWQKLEPMLIALHVGQIFNQCTMGLSIEIGERKILKSKWLDFSYFSTKDVYFDLYWCKTAHILPEKNVYMSVMQNIGYFCRKT